MDEQIVKLYRDQELTILQPTRYLMEQLRNLDSILVEIIECASSVHPHQIPSCLRSRKRHTQRLVLSLQDLEDESNKMKLVLDGLLENISKLNHEIDQAMHAE